MNNKKTRVVICRCFSINYVRIDIKASPCLLYIKNLCLLKGKVAVDEYPIVAYTYKYKNFMI